ncbi:GNAT family N-acetyltransferase [Streptomyces sp. NPDC000410]|uniref:GNAT family N-acetyltransferase n=1 Tax=Streptomyces sp. NPDC000410 TaxID=3154254 RepID=UPI00331B4956
MTDLRVADGDDELAERLDKELTEFNERATGVEVRELSARVTGDDGELVGGLTGWTWGDCGFVEMLWVHEDHRHGGWGGKLLRAAEEEALRRGCVRMVVASYTFQAPPFYRRQGYAEIGRIEGMPGGHADVHFCKALAS